MLSLNSRRESLYQRFLAKKKDEWKFTRGRQESLKKARKEHSRLVRLGRLSRDTRAR